MLDSVLSNLKTRTWLAEILVSSGASSAYGLESVFPSANRYEGAMHNGRARTSRWYRYQRGEMSPSKRTVALVEARCPGTSAWIRTPLWELMTEGAVELELLTAALAAARPHLAKHLKFSNGALARPCTVESLWRQGDLASLSALLAIVRHAEVTRSLAQYVESSWAALNLAIFLSHTTALSVVRAELLDALWNRFFSDLRDLPSPLRGGWSYQHSFKGLQRVLQECPRRPERFACPRDLARLAFWLAKEFPLFVIPACLPIASILDRYDAQLSANRRYSAHSSNFIQQAHFWILRRPQDSRDQLVNEMNAAQSYFVTLCQNRADARQAPIQET